MKTEFAHNPKINFSVGCSIEFLENILISLDESKTNNFFDNFWKVSNLNINFSSIENLKNSHPAWANLLPVDIVVFSKIIFLTNVQGIKSSTVIRYKFDSIIKTLYFLAENNLLCIDQIDYEKYLAFYLINRIDDNRVVLKLTPLSYANYKSGISNKEWLRTLKNYQLPMIGFRSFFSESFVNKSLKNTIEELSENAISFGDWKSGGNFNHLTLDYGRYYVDHCSDFFEKHINLAIALRQTLTQAGEIVQKAGVFVNNKNLRSYVMLVIGHFLAGKEIKDFSKAQLKRHSYEWFNAIRISTQEIFQKNFNKLQIFDLLVSNENLNKIASIIQLDISSDEKRQWLKQIIDIRCDQLINENNLLASQLRAKELEFLLCLSSNETACKIIKLIDDTYQSLIRSNNVVMPTPDFFNEIGIREKGSQSKYVNNFLKFVESAGAVRFIALTGWRESEYGFSLGNFDCYKNNDILDQLANPIRYEITWQVSKTNGQTHLKREITYNAYYTALKLSKLVQSDTNLPCLYTFNQNTKKPCQSSEIIPRLVGNLWSHFVFYYQPFKSLELLDELNCLSSKDILDDSEEIRLNHLMNLSVQNNWKVLENDIHLREAKIRANQEFDRVTFLIEHDLRRGFIWNYLNGNLDLKHKSLLDTYLSLETKNIIAKFNSPEEIDQVFARGVIDEITQDCLYPTPHAFRHMWAEAVYRRFDGDAGWMIRSNFKHISPTMWLAYIKDKDNRRQHELIKRHVISTLLSNYIRKNGEGYAGPLDKFLRRLFDVTHVTRPEDLIHVAENFASHEIENVKSTPWGYCLLKKRDTSNAKCAEQGIPQRHKASPAFCLGCNNNLTQNGNIEGILLGISNDLIVLKTPRVPDNFYYESLNTVSNAFNHLQRLKADHEILIEIDQCLKSSEANRYELK